MSIPYYRELLAAGLIDADYAFINGTLYDTIAGKVITPGNSRLQRNGAVTFPSTQLDSNGFVLQGATEGTIMIKVRPTSIMGTAGTNAIAASDTPNGFLLGAITGYQASFAVHDGTTFVSVNAGSFVLGELAWYSGKFQNNDKVYVAKNGVTLGSTSFAGKVADIPANVFRVGGRSSAGRGVPGLYARAFVVRVLLSDAQEQTLQAELDSIGYDLNSGGIVIDPATGATLYDYKGGYGIIESTANEGGATGTPISNTEWVCGDATGRFKVVTQTGPNGQRGKGIKCITGGTLTKLSVSAADTWLYHWYDDSATAWKTQADAIHAGATFTLAANDILWIADEAGPRAYDIRHTPA